MIMLFTSAAGFALMSLLAAQAPDSPSQATAAQPSLPVSLTRIRKALNNPAVPRLTAPLPTADFSVLVLEKQRFEDLLLLLGLGGGSPMPTVLFGSAAVRPSSAADLTAIGGAVGRKLSRARRERRERLAREEVQRSLIEFCTVHECLPRKP